MAPTSMFPCRDPPAPNCVAAEDVPLTTLKLPDGEAEKIEIPPLMPFPPAVVVLMVPSLIVFPEDAPAIIQTNPGNPFPPVPVFIGAGDVIVPELALLPSKAYIKTLPLLPDAPVA